MGKAEDTKARVERAALTLFVARGVAETTTKEIAMAASVAEGTIYRYFPSKRDLFLAAVDRVMRRLRVQVDAAIAAIADIADPLERVTAATRAYLDFFASDPGRAELLIQERANFKDRQKPTYFQHLDANIYRWQALFRSLIAEGRARDVPVERITGVLSNLAYGTMLANHFRGQRRSSAAQAAAMLDIAFHGILTGDARDASRGNARRRGRKP